MKPSLAAPLLGIVAACLSMAAGAAVLDAFVDPEDGEFDTSEWLLDRKGFLPVPIVITEPAVGYGGGLALVYFRESFRDSAGNKGPSGEAVPPDIYAAAFAGTANGTKVGGLGGMLSFRGDRWRYRGFVGKTYVNLDFYGIGDDSSSDAAGIGYNLDGWGAMQQLLARVRNSNVWLSARWVYLDLDSSLTTDDAAADLPARSDTKRNSGIGPAIEYDSRDNIFTPNRGWKGSFEATFYDPSWGSETVFQSYRAYVFAYTPLGSNWVLGTRLDGRTVSGRVPFYFYPAVDLRGIPAARVQDQSTAVVETELRWNVTSRWALVGFIGAARAWGRKTDFDEASTPVAGGAGFRYLLARRLGLYAGVDYARSQYDDAIYLQIGGGWR